MKSRLLINVSVIYRDEEKKSLEICLDKEERGLYTDVTMKQIVSDMVQYYIDHNILKDTQGTYELYINIPGDSTVAQVGETSPVKVLLITSTPISGFDPNPEGK